jgi:hypothetical protein
MLGQLPLEPAEERAPFIFPDNTDGLEAGLSQPFQVVLQGDKRKIVVEKTAAAFYQWKDLLIDPANDIRAIYVVNRDG